MSAVTELRHEKAAGLTDAVVPVENPTGYEPPRVRLTDVPVELNTFDAFTVHGVAEGSDVQGARVSVCMAGVTRHGVVHDGRFEVRFEDDALDYYRVGVRPLVVKVTDSRDNTAQHTEWVGIDEFQRGFVNVDPVRDVVVEDAGDELLCTGELALGTHTQGRELVLLLVTADAEELVVATADVQAGWHYGEFEARFGVGTLGGGRYQVRAVLTDSSSPRLLCTDVSDPFALRPFVERFHGDETLPLAS